MLKYCLKVFNPFIWVWNKFNYIAWKELTKYSVYSEYDHKMQDVKYF